MTVPLMSLPRVVCVLAVAGLGGCAACEPLEPLDLPGERCQPLLAGADCMLPYPSDFFVVADEATATGRRVSHEGAAKLFTSDGYSGDLNDSRATDGYSRTPLLIALLGEAASDDGFVGVFDDHSEAARLESPTLLVDAETGALVPHFADLDPRADDPARAAIVLHPTVLLEARRRYVVALKGVATPAGELASAPEGFRRLRERRGAEDPALAAVQERFDAEVFPVLEEVGVERAELQLAWDFTTGSDEEAWGDVLRARELALEHLADNPPVVTDVNFFEDTEPGVWRKVFGRVRGPLVMEHENAGADVARDDDGRVRISGETTFSFVAIVPESVRERFAPGLLMQYGHGFFGSRGELDSPMTHSVVDRLGAVTFAIDWVGMSEDDLGQVVSTVGEDVSRSAVFTERVTQAMVNWLTLTAALEGALQDEPAFRRPDEAGAAGVIEDPAAPGETNAGALVWEPGRLHFMGISMGHILGGVYAALNPKLERVALHVGGAGFSHMMFRANPFQRFLFLMDLSVPDPLDQQKLAAMMQRHLDRVDPAVFAPLVFADDLPAGPDGGGGARKVLLQAGIGDTQVPNFATHLHARALGLPLVTPAVQEAWGLEKKAAPVEGRGGLVMFDLGYDDSFYAVAVPPEEETAVHNELRQHEEPIEQVRAFFEEGHVTDACGGPCALEAFTPPD